MRQDFPRRPCAIGASLVLSGLMLGTVVAGAAGAATTPPQPAAAQPTLPEPMPTVTTPSLSPKPLHVHRRARRLHAGRRRIVPIDREPLERPALGSVVLVAPLPRPVEPPHISVPVPAYPLDAFAAAYTTPPPPVVCHRVRRDPDAPDPHLRGEIPVFCEPDTP